MKRKVVSMVLAGVMATSMLVGCGAKKEETSTPEETVAQEQTAEEKTEEKTETTDGAAETTAGDDSHEVNFPDGFPKKEIKLIVPFAAGGAFDVMARTLQPIVKDMYNVDLVVECVSGAGSAVGVTQTLTSAPDGYTIGFGSTSYLGLIAQGKMEMDPEAAEFLCTISSDPMVLVAKAGGDYDTLDKYLDAAKANPGTVTLGNPGSNNTNQAFSKFLDQAVGEGTFQMIPYSDGDSRVVTELLGDHLAAGVLKPNSCKAQLASGELVIIGSFTHDRLESFPDVPTFEEKGLDVFPYGDVAQTVCFAFAPKGVDPQIKEAIGNMLWNAVMSDDFQKLAKESAFETPAQTGDELRSFVLDDLYGGAEVLAKKVFTN